MRPMSPSPWTLTSKKTRCVILGNCLREREQCEDEKGSKQAIIRPHHHLGVLGNVRNWVHQRRHSLFCRDSLIVVLLIPSHTFTFKGVNYDEENEEISPSTGRNHQNRHGVVRVSFGFGRARWGLPPTKFTPTSRRSKQARRAVDCRRSRLLKRTPINLLKPGNEHRRRVNRSAQRSKLLQPNISNPKRQQPPTS